MRGSSERMSDFAQQLAGAVCAALEAHSGKASLVRTGNGAYTQIKCTCGWTDSTCTYRTDAIAAHRVHVAAVHARGIAALRREDEKHGQRIDGSCLCGAANGNTRHSEDAALAAFAEAAK